MRKFSSKKSKKLSILVGMALTCSVAFGMMPSDVAEAASQIKVEKDLTTYKYAIYDVSGGSKVLLESDIASMELAEKVQVYTGEKGAVVEIDKGTAQSLQAGDVGVTGITVGAGTTIVAKGSSSSASVVGGDTASQITIDGASIKGENVNLSSIAVDLQGDTSATINVSGTVGTLSTAGANNGAQVYVNSDNLQVAELSIAAPIQVNGTLNAQEVTIADGAKVVAGSGTLVADTLTLESGATINDGAKFQVNTIKVDSVDDSTIGLITTVSKNNASEAPIKVEGNNLTSEQIGQLNDAVSSAGGSVSVTSKVTVSGSGDSYTVGGEAVSKDELLDKVNETLAKDKVSSLELNKAAAQALRDADKPIQLKASQTLTVIDEAQGTVSATAKNDVAVSVSGTSISAGDGAEFTSVMVDVAASNTIVNNISGAKIDVLTVKKGSLSTSDVTIGSLNLSGGEVVAGNGTITVTQAADINGKVTGGSIVADGAQVNIGEKANISSTVKADTVTISGMAAGKIEAKSVSVTGSGMAVGGITAGTVEFASGATVAGSISADVIKVADVSTLSASAIDFKDGLVIEKVGGAMSQSEKDALAAQLPPGTTITVKDEANKEGSTLESTQKPTPDPGPDPEPTPDPDPEPTPDPDPKPEGSTPEEEADKAMSDVQEAVKAITGSEDVVIPTEADVKNIQDIDPFTGEVPTIDDINKLASISKDQADALAKAKGDLVAAKAKLAIKLAAATTDAEKAEIQGKIDEVDGVLKELPIGVSPENFKDMANDATKYVQEAGKTAAAPSATSARTAGVITSVMTQNVVTRTAEIRGFASAIDEGRPAPEKVWFQYKHTNMDVDGGDVYSKSTINTNNFQLGYDTQIGTNDYLGAYIGTTTGNADFRGPKRDGRVDIENAFDFGVYGTHMLPNDQYIDYMIHTGKFDSKLSDVKYGTNDTGVMVGYGLKLAQTENLTLNPYVQLAYDKVDVDSYTIAGNTVNSDKSNNWTAKLGLNLIDASGFYGGLAYSRGLSGSYNAYLNGVPMPTQDNNANVIYLSMGYRAMMSKNALLDLSMEKTFADYKGWTAAGKINFYF